MIRSDLIYKSSLTQIACKLEHWTRPRLGKSVMVLRRYFKSGNCDFFLIHGSIAPEPPYEAR